MPKSSKKSPFLRVSKQRHTQNVSFGGGGRLTLRLYINYV